MFTSANGIWRHTARPIPSWGSSALSASPWWHCNAPPNPGQGSGYVFSKPGLRGFVDMLSWD
jgi:hypothetical protein